MENMRTILVDQDSGIIIMIVSVPADMWSSIDQQNLFAGAPGQPFSQNAARETSANNEIIERLDLHVTVVSGNSIHRVTSVSVLVTSRIASLTCSSNFATIESHEFSRAMVMPSSIACLSGWLVSCLHREIN